MGLTLDIPENLAKIVRSKVEAWTTELKVLRRDPTVRKFLELQDKIDQSHAFMVEAAPSSSALRALYRFTPTRKAETDGKASRFGLPANELSQLKAEDLEDVAGLPIQERKRS